MRLIVGLGNPGSEYDRTRHNIGFAAVDAIAQKLGASLRKEKFESLYGTAQIADEQVLLVKPQTYMNLSGQAVRQFMDYWKIDSEDLLVLHDELDLELGVMRLAIGSGAAGNRGVKSIIDHVGGKNFYRLRLGIGRPERGNPVDFVLNRFSKEQQVVADELTMQAMEATQQWITKGPDWVQRVYHRK